MKEKLKEKRWYICTFVITFLARMLRIRGTYAMRVATDDIGMLSGAAYLAGYDWSSVVSTTKYYGQGWYSLFAPVLRIIENPATIWAVIVIVNICIVALACVFIQYIGIKYLRMENNFITSLISIFISMAVVPSNTLSQEAILFCLTIIISWLLMKSVQEEFSSLKRCVFMILTVVFSIWAYLIHTRAVVLLIAIPVALLSSSLRRKKKLINLAGYTISAVILYLVAGILKEEIIRLIWGGSTNSIMNAELPISASTIQSVFSLKGIRVVFDCFVSNFFTACMRLYGIPCVIIILVILLLIYGFKKDGRNYQISENGKVLLVFSFTCFLIGLAGVAVMWGKGVVSTYWKDEVNVYYKGFCYFRYYATFAGPALFVALEERFYNEKYNRRLGCFMLGAYGGVVFYYLLVILRRISQSEYVNRAVLQYVTYTDEGVDILNHILSIGIALLILTVILCAGKYSKYGLILAIVINVIMPSTNEGLISKPIMGTIGDAGYHLVRNMEKDGMEIDDIYCADERWACFLQFFLKEKRILVGAPTEEDRILVFHSNNLREDERLEGLPKSYECIVLDDNECVWVSDKELYDYILNAVEAE